MADEKQILWILHYKPYNYGEMQYAFETSLNINYEDLFKLVGLHVDLSHGIISYARGERAANILIKGDVSLNLAINYFGYDAYTEGIHLNYTERNKV